MFLRLGFTAFGGPAAHIALLETEVVRRRGWLSSQRFLDLLGAANLIPGPSSSELAISIGYERAGALGLLVAGACFILPAALITGALAWGYVRFGALPKVAGIFYGVKPVVIAIVLQALVALAPKALKTRGLIGLGLATLAASALGVGALPLLLGAGIATLAVRGVARGAGKTPVLSLAVLGKVGLTGAAAPVSLFGILCLFLKMGAVVFGSGYVLLAFLRADLVERLHWLTEAQLLDAVAVGQITPGPVFCSATFVGYLLAGAPGAAVATFAVFLPAFVLIAASRPLLARVHEFAPLRDVLDGVNVASLSLMAVVTVQLGRAALIDLTTLAIACLSSLLLLKWRLNSLLLVLGGALTGLFVHGLR